MSSQPSLPSRHAVSDYVEEGAYIAAILLVWGVIAAFFAFGVGNFGSHGSILRTVGPQLGALFALAGSLNALVFVLYRAIDYWHQYD